MQLGLGLGLGYGGGGAAGWTPASLGSKLLVWLDFQDDSVMFADAAGTVPATSSVYRVNNKGTVPINALQSSASRQPTKGIRTINGYPAIDITGDSFNMTGLSSYLTGEHEIWIGAQADTYGSSPRLFESSSSGQFKLQITTSGTVLSGSHTTAFTFSTLTRTADTYPHLFGQYMSGSSVYAFQDDDIAAAGSANTTGAGNFSIFCDQFGTANFDGAAAFFIAIDGTLSADERLLMKAWVNSVMGLSLYTGYLTLNEFSSNNMPFGVSDEGGGVWSAPIRVSGTSSAGQTIQARVRQGGTTIVDWHDIGTVSASGNWAFKTSRVPRGDGYTVEVRPSTATAQVRTMTKVFNVCDLIATTGDSITANGHGFLSSDLAPELQLYNGGNTVAFLSDALGGSVVLASSDSSGVWYVYPTGNTTDITQWSDLTAGTRGAIWENHCDEIGGEITAIINTSGTNDTGFYTTSEGIRAIKIGEQRKYAYPSTLAGRDIPFLIGELGPNFYFPNTTNYHDNLRQTVRNTQDEIIAADDQVYKGAVFWDAGMADSIHPTNYPLIWERTARVLANVLGYATPNRQGSYISSFSKTGASEVTATITLAGDDTDMVVNALDKHFRVMDGATRKTISSTTKGTASGGTVDVVITTSTSISSSTPALYYRYGNGGYDLGLTMDSGTNTLSEVNAGIATVALGNGTYALPLEKYNNGA